MLMFFRVRVQVTKVLARLIIKIYLIKGRLAQEISIDLSLWGSVKLPTAVEMLCILLLPR